MTVAAPVLSAQGNVLLAPGATLNETMLDNLRRRSIEFVTVTLPDTRDAETIAREQRTAGERVDFIFRGPGSAARKTLHAAVRAYREGQLA